MHWCQSVHKKPWSLHLLCHPPPPPLNGNEILIRTGYIGRYWWSYGGVEETWPGQVSASHLGYVVVELCQAGWGVSRGDRPRVRHVAILWVSTVRRLQPLLLPACCLLGDWLLHLQQGVVWQGPECPLQSLDFLSFSF